MQERPYFRLILPIIFIILFAASCGNPNSYFAEGEKQERKFLLQVMEDLKNPELSSEGRYILNQQIIKALIGEEYRQKLNLYLTTYVENHRDDPYNGYYLLLVAKNYKKEDAIPFATHYFERILKNYTDLLVMGKSIHYACLTNLIKLSKDPEVKINYYKELISRFPEEIDKGQIFYYLARTYEELGEWQLAIQAYRNFMLYTDSRIPGVPDAHEIIGKKTAFYDRQNKDWILKDLDDLIWRIRSAIKEGRSGGSTLSRYMAKVNFFAVSWQQKETEADREFLSNIGGFMGRNIVLSHTLDEGSNNQEAYLKTTGWSYRIKTWYLYFRKIYFPADPEIHGKWEWAGIYFGDKPFAGSTEKD
jgi:tetratricopeptide (TPR) repeat protein